MRKLTIHFRTISGLEIRNISTNVSKFSNWFHHILRNEIRGILRKSQKNENLEKGKRLNNVPKTNCREMRLVVMIGTGSVGKIRLETRKENQTKPNLTKLTVLFLAYDSSLRRLGRTRLGWTGKVRNKKENLTWQTWRYRSMLSILSSKGMVGPG